MMDPKESRRRSSIAATPASRPRHIVRHGGRESRIPVRPALFFLLLLAAAVQPACGTAVRLLAPRGELSFPEHPLYVDSAGGRHYDTNGDRAVDFVARPGKDGILDELLYDDDFDGTFDRTVHLSDSDPRKVPHVVILMDSIPYRVAIERYAAGDLHWFFPPAKVIAPFPSMSIVIFADILHGPKEPAATERYLDLDAKRVVNEVIESPFTLDQPWQRSLDYHLAGALEIGASFVDPEAFLRAEMGATERAAHRAFAQLARGERTDPIVISYLSASSGMVSVRGLEGLERSLDLLEPFCLGLLHDMSGRIEISVVSDHGHDLVPSKRFDPEPVLRAAGFSPKDDWIDFDREVFLEEDGLVRYFGVQTGHPEEVASALIARPELALVFYRDGDRVIVRDARGRAAIDHRGDRYRYRPIDRDVLGYAPVLAALAERGGVDSDGFVADRDLFLATADHEYPDAPRRLCDAFESRVRFPCSVLCVTKDEYHVGLAVLEWFITMRSSHGGLAQRHSDGVLFTTIRGAPSGPLRSADVMPAIEPRFDPATRFPRVP